jgi:hypothetical protein
MVTFKKPYNNFDINITNSKTDMITFEIDNGNVYDLAHVWSTEFTKMWSNRHTV